MLKKIIKIFLLILFMIGLYFYIFPNYPNYGISDTKFLTKHYDKDYDSQGNGFHIWKELHQYLGEHKDFLNRIDLFYKCRFENTCARSILKECMEKKICSKNDFNQEDKDYVIEYFYNEFLASGDQALLDDIIQTYLVYLQNINEKGYILSLDINNFEENSGGFFTKGISYSPFFVISRVIGYRASEYNNKKRFQVYSKNYVGLIGILNKFDGVYIDYASLKLAINNQTKNIRNNYNSNDKYTTIFKSLIRKNVILNGFTANSIKRNYTVGRLYLDNGGIENFQEHTKYFSITGGEIGIPLLRYLPRFLFYSKKETFNLMKKHSENELLSDKSETTIEHFKYNGKNLIGRGFVNKAIGGSFSSDFKKEGELIQSQKELIKFLDE